MNVAMDAQFRSHVLRRDWKSAVQTLRAALEIDRKDPVALNQLDDQRNRFLAAANPLIGKARLLMMNGDHSAAEELAGKFDKDFPEWSELAEADEALWSLWSLTRGMPTAPNLPETIPPFAKPVDDTNTKVANIRKLVEEAQAPSLITLSTDSLKTLAGDLTQAQREIAANSNLTTLDKDVTRSLESVRARIRECKGRSVLQMAAIALVSVVGLIGGGAICWAVLRSAHLNGVTDYVRLLVQCIAYLFRSRGHQFMETVFAAVGVSALFYWVLLAAPRLWNRAFYLRDVDHMIFAAATIITFVLSVSYVAVDFMDPVSKQDIQKWRDELLSAQHNEATIRHYAVGDALKDFEQQHPFLGGRLLSEKEERLTQDLSARLKSGGNAVADIEGVSNYLDKQTRVVLPSIQSDSKLAILVLFIVMLSVVFTAISFAAYRSLK